MQEKIILAPGANSTELLRTLAKFGVNTIGLRIVGPVELAKMALTRSGISTRERFLSYREEPALVFSFVKDIPYFKAASYTDAEALAQALTTARGLIVDNEEGEIERILKEGEFKEKNEAILLVYKKYMHALKEQGLTDSISLVRKALKEAAPFESKFCTLSEFPLTPLEAALLEHVSESKYTQMDLSGLFRREKKEINIKGYTAAYGAINEAEDILSRIYKEGIPLDKCVVACANTSLYTQIFYDLSKRYDIPVTFGSGISVNNTNPAVLLKLLYDWNHMGYNGVDALRKLIFSSAFDREKLSEKLGIILERDILGKIISMAGNLRICFDKDINKQRLAALKGETLSERETKILPLVELLAKELEKGYSEILKEYCVIRHGDDEKADLSGLSVITGALDAYLRFANESSVDDIIPNVLSKTISSGSSREGALHVCSISSALSSLRENLFVCGLSSSEFPGSPSENFLLLDSDLDLFGYADATTSSKRISSKKKTFLDLIEVASCLNISAYLSYSDFDLAEIKDKNPSSALYEIYESSAEDPSMEKFKSLIRHTGYFKSDISPSEAVGKEITSGHIAEPGLDIQSIPDSKDELDREWSPTALELYFQCPRHFYLRYIAGIEEREADDPFTVMTAADQGNILHEMMEETANRSIDEAEFQRLSEEKFDSFLKRRPPIHSNEADALKKEFLEMMALAYKQDPKNEAISAEDKYRFTHSSGIKIQGRPDRVEKTSAGEYIIADYKTKRRTEHEKDDIDSCLQVVIYAWLCSQAGLDIKSAEYRYVRLGKIVSCSIDANMYSQLNEKLLQFKQSMENNDFPINKSNDACKYCTFGDICEWDTITGEVKEDE